MDQRLLECLSIIWVIFLMLVVIKARSQKCVLSDAQQQLNDSCLNSNYHKGKPGPEPLKYQCEPWKDHACCTANNSIEIHKFDGFMHNFSFNHCQPLSEACRKHFIQDLCFYACSSNIGPWIVEVKMKSRKQRYYNVPLCKNECDDWWDVCKFELTCRDNWMKGFNWTTGTNVCPAGHECKTFEAYFKNASNFCQQVWDGSFKVVPDNEPCMTLGMHGNISQNKRVTNWYLKKKFCNTSLAEKGQIIIIFLLAVLQIFFCN